MKNIDYYSKKPVNPKYYSKIVNHENSLKGLKVLTQEEFMNHEQGLVYLDYKTNKLTFLIKD